MSFEVKEILALPDKEKKRIADLIYESLQNEDDSRSRRRIVCGPCCNE